MNKTTTHKCKEWLELCRQLYNACLEQRIDAYKRCGKSISQFDQRYELKALRTEFVEYRNIDSQVLDDVTRRLNKAYSAFFSRLQKGQKPGFPRFKSYGRYNSFTFRLQGWKLDGKYLHITKLGTLKLNLDRLIEGNIKTLTVSCSGESWFVSFSCDNVPQKFHPSHTGKVVGIDVGLTHFLTDSEGRKVDNPRFFRSSQNKLKLAQQALSRKDKGSNNRERARKVVSKIHTKIANRRNDFSVKLAREYVTNYDFIAIEDLKIKNMIRNHSLAKSISDVAWASFFCWLLIKAEEAGKEVKKIDPRNTSRQCRKCGHIQNLTLDDRVFACENCSHTEDRDLNASINIRDRAISLGPTRLTTYE